MHDLAATQHDFAVAVLNPFAPVPASLRTAAGRRTESGFAIYRNNVAAGLIDAVVARYPVVCRLAGEAFRPAAHHYVLSEPPQSPVLLHYGETFPRFLRSLGSAPSFEYLADIAEVEMARVKAYHAADAEPVGREAFASLEPEHLDRLRLIIHPSVSLIASRFPIVTIWEANQSDDDGAIIRQWGAEAALVVRPFLDVEVWRLPPGSHAFLEALSNGETIAVAAEAGESETSDFDIVANLALLIEANIVVGFCGNA